jgi:hypothetical protein
VPYLGSREDLYTAARREPRELKVAVGSSDARVRLGDGPNTVSPGAER